MRDKYLSQYRRVKLAVVFVTAVVSFTLGFAVGVIITGTYWVDKL